MKAGLRTDKTSGQAVAEVESKSSGQAVAEVEAKSFGQVEAEAEVKSSGQTEGCEPSESPTGTVFHM